MLKSKSDKKYNDNVLDKINQDFTSIDDFLFDKSNLLAGTVHNDNRSSPGMAYDKLEKEFHC